MPILIVVYLDYLGICLLTTGPWVPKRCRLLLCIIRREATKHGKQPQRHPHTCLQALVTLFSPASAYTMGDSEHKGRSSLVGPRGLKNDTIKDGRAALAPASWQCSCQRIIWWLVASRQQPSACILFRDWGEGGYVVRAGTHLGGRSHDHGHGIWQAKILLTK